jgi:hypothetical protein
MQEITLSLSENTLKLSTVEKGEFKGVSAEIAKDVAQENKILDEESFAEAVKDLLSRITGKNPRNLSLNIVLDPYDVIFKFIAVNKKDGDIEEQIMNDIGPKLDGNSLDDLYFSYLKIAPFVYQFIAVRKELLESYLTLSNNLGMTLKSVTPWVTLLPKFVDINEPAIFISNFAGKQFVALSEFNGIFFTDVFEEDKSTEELQKIVEELSVYKRKDPISKVYIYNYDSFSLNPKYNVLELEIPNSDMEESKGYEMHLLVTYMTKKDSTLLNSQNNLLNLLPLPENVDQKKKSLVPVAAITIVLLAVVIYGGTRLLGGGNIQDVLPKRGQDDVLSEANNIVETTPSQEETTEEEEPQEVLLKEDLSMRIENGAGISGIAARTQEMMENFGYTVESIGNADVVGRTTTLLRFKPEAKKYEQMLTEDMSDFFDTEVGEDLPQDAEYDVLIIIGTDAEI